MGELIQIGDILIRSNNTSSSIDSDFANTHCAKMDCHACCKEMTIAMTVAEFIAY